MSAGLRLRTSILGILSIFHISCTKLGLLARRAARAHISDYLWSTVRRWDRTMCATRSLLLQLLLLLLELSSTDI